MTKRGMRGFAAGLWLAAAVLAYFHFTDQGTEKAEANPDHPTKAQVQQFLQSHNEIAVNKKEYNALKKASTKKKSDQKNKKDNQANDEKDEQNKEKKSTHKTKLKIKKGMTSQDVAEQLKKAKIIQDADKLQDYMGDHDLEEKVQLGSFKLSSDMKLKKIAKKITS